jgi:general secretion pathway protein K
MTQRGFALLIVLWSMALLAVLLTQVTATGRSEAQLVINLRRAAVLRAAADGAVNEAIFHLTDPAPASRWPADGAARRLPPGPGAVAVELRIDDEAGKVNPNTAPTDFLDALLRAAGATAQDAARIAQAMDEWRQPSGENPATGLKAQRYRQAGLAYAPPSERFQTLDEIGLVMGMTPTLLAALKPHLTLGSDGTVDPRAADPVVLRAFGLAGVPTTAAGPPAPPSAVTVTARAQDPSGAAFVRQAAVSLGRDRSGRLFRITAWTEPPIQG